MESTKEFTRDEKEEMKLKIRECVTGIYDIQSLRVATGNRLVALFTKKFGMEAGTSFEDEENKELQKTVDQLKKEYRRVADAIASRSVSVNKAISQLKDEAIETVGKDGTKKSEKALVYINSKTDYELVDSYMKLLDSEASLTKVLKEYVEAHPMYERFFKNIKGCGTLMSAMCLAYLDPYKANHVSSFYKYCGLDTVQDTDSEGNLLWIPGYLDQYGEFHRVGNQVREKYRFEIDGVEYDGKVKATDDFDIDGNQIYKTEDGRDCIRSRVVKSVNGDWAQVFEDVETGAEYVGEVMRSEHGRRKGDVEMYEYIDKNGETKLKRGITYNPKLKTKIVEVLTRGVIMAGDPVYSKIYYDYKNRLARSEEHKGKTLMHRERMARRYLAKQFLRNLWVSWREYEGLEVDAPYEVAKLGNKPHHLNQYQMDVYNKQKARA